MSEFCTRCGAQLREDGICPNCDGSYTVSGIFDQPQVQPESAPVYAEEAPDVAEPVYDAPDTAESYAYTPSYESANETPSSDYTFGNTGYDSGSSYDNSGYGSGNSYGGYSSQPSSAAAAAPRAKKTGVADALKEWVDCVVSFFKGDPLGTVDDVMKGETWQWAIFAGLNVILGALCTAGMFGNGFRWMLDKVFGSYAMLVGFYKEYNFGNMFVLFLFSLFTLSVLFCGVTACEYGLLSLEKKKPRIDKMISMTAICFFPMTAACAGAYLFSFFFFRLAAVLLLGGAMASITLLNKAVENHYGNLPFWHVVLCNVTQMVAALLIISFSLTVVPA